MKNQQIAGNEKRSTVLTLTGITVMILLTVTKVAPSTNIAGYSVFAGIAFFFITEAAGKTQKAQSGLRFHTIAADLKKPGVIVWLLLSYFRGKILWVEESLGDEEMYEVLMGIRATPLKRYEPTESGAEESIYRNV